MTCTYCGTEIEAGASFVEHEGMYFCNNLHKYEWAAEGSRKPDTPPQFQPMDLGDVFDATFQLTGKVFTRSFLLILIILVPSCILFTFATDQLYSSFANRLSSPETIADPTNVSSMMSSIAWFGVTMFLVFLCSQIGDFAVATVACNAFGGNRLSIAQALRDTFSFRLWSLFGQYLVQIVAIGGIFVVGFALFVFAMVSKVGGLMFAGVLLLVAGIGCAVYLLIRWAFAVPAIAYDNLYAMESLKSSANLVKGNWWRVFGILLLFGIITSLITTLISTPISMVTMWDFYKEYFHMLGAKQSTDPAAMSKMFQSVGKGVGINLSINFVLSASLTPIYLSVFYFDLRARKQILDSSLVKPSGIFSDLEKDINSTQYGN